MEAQSAITYTEDLSVPISHSERSSGTERLMLLTIFTFAVIALGRKGGTPVSATQLPVGPQQVHPALLVQNNEDPTATATETQTSVPTPSETPKPTVTPTSTPSFTVTSTTGATLTVTAVATDVVTATVTASPSNTSIVPTFTPSPSAESTDQPTQVLPTETDTVVPTLPVTVTATPEGGPNIEYGRRIELLSLAIPIRVEPEEGGGAAAMRMHEGDEPEGELIAAPIQFYIKGHRLDLVNVEYVFYMVDVNGQTVVSQTLLDADNLAEEYNPDITLDGQRGVYILVVDTKKLLPEGMPEGQVSMYLERREGNNITIHSNNFVAKKPAQEVEVTCEGDSCEIAGESQNSFTASLDSGFSVDSAFWDMGSTTETRSSSVYNHNAAIVNIGDGLVGQFVYTIARDGAGKLYYGYTTVTSEASEDNFITYIPLLVRADPVNALDQLGFVPTQAALEKQQRLQEEESAEAYKIRVEKRERELRKRELDKRSRSKYIEVAGRR